MEVQVFLNLVMGGHESRIQQPAPVQSFTASMSAPARVKFDPELLTQLHQEQEERLEHRRAPPSALFEPEEPSVESERKALIQHGWEVLATKTKSREMEADREDQVSSCVGQRLTELTSRSENGSASKVFQCQGDATRALTELGEPRHVSRLHRFVVEYEHCVRRNVQ